MSDRPVILVVDDDQPILVLMRTLLREFGFEPVTAASGEQAIEESRSRRPDLILLDRNMPGMSGDEVLLSLRADAALAAVPVLIVSGEPMSAGEVRAIGATQAVLKPFDVPELMTLISQHVRRV